MFVVVSFSTPSSGQNSINKKTQPLEPTSIDVTQFLVKSFPIRNFGKEIPAERPEKRLKSHFEQIGKICCPVAQNGHHDDDDVVVDDEDWMEPSLASTSVYFLLFSHLVFRLTALGSGSVVGRRRIFYFT